MRIELKDILKDFPKRQQDSHKGSFGKILNIAGSKFYAGAAILSSLAALKTGAGYVTLACPDTISASINAYSPDITIFPLKSADGISISPENIEILTKKAEEFDVISIGSGLSQTDDVKNFVIHFLQNVKKPIIIDADGLNTISEQKEKKLPKNSIITPHPKELSRLLYLPVDEIQSDREKYAKLAAKNLKTIVVLKGHRTIVTDGEKTYINASGNSALAKAGSGDVLTGMIAGILAQNKNLFSAAALGVYLHGKVGEAGSEEQSEYGLLASEIIKYIPKAIMKIF